MDELTPLSDATLSSLRADVAVPGYDRSKLTPGIVHIGLGNFHRAHQAWYLQRLMQQGKAMDWAIIGAGVRPGDAAQRARLEAQDFLTTLIELDPAGVSAEVCGSMIGYLPVERDNAALIARMADPAIRIVALTVTEGGYYLAASGGLDTGHADIMHDAQNPETPRTAFGAMVAALRLRRQAGIGPFTGQSCDNLQHNGAVLRQTVVGLARLSDPDLANWIDTHVSFPGAMVDCIVPATGPNELALARDFGISDQVPVTHENFRQWVIEDNFCAGRPPWEDAGATLSDRVGDYETMKLRILNGGHQIIAATGALLGIETIAGAMAHPLIRALLRKVVTEEIAPHVGDVPGYTPLEYLDLIDARFSNDRIDDTTRRVAFDGSSRQPGFLLASVRDGVLAGMSVGGLALVSAIWARYCAGTCEDGTAIAPNDPLWAELSSRALAAQDRPAAWLEMRHIYGDLADVPEFADTFSDELTMIYATGVEAAIREYLTDARA